MAEILWLDDDARMLEGHADSLRREGHSVTLVSDDTSAVELLENGKMPDLFIQDIGRPAAASEAVLALGPPDGYAGWLFYERILRPHFPQLPVLIYSALARLPNAQWAATEYNLNLVHKDKWSWTRLGATVGGILARQLPSQKLSLNVPLIASLDFDKVSYRLIRHLAEHPDDLHSVSWSSFEELVERLLGELGYDVWHTPLTRVFEGIWRQALFLVSDAH